jgi:hypothetical protein
MKTKRKATGSKSDECMMWAVVLTSCFVMIWTALAGFGG